MSKVRAFFKRRPTETIEEARRRVSRAIEWVLASFVVVGALSIFGTPQISMIGAVIAGILTGVVAGASSWLIARKYVQ